MNTQTGAGNGRVKEHKPHGENVNVLAIDIGGTHFRVALFSQAGELVLASEGETSSSGGRVWMLEAIRERSQGLIGKSTFPVKTCGISFGGKATTSVSGFSDVSTIQMNGNSMASPNRHMTMNKMIWGGSSRVWCGRASSPS